MHRAVSTLLYLKGDVSRNIGVFKASQTGVGSGGCCQFLGSSAPHLSLRSKKQRRALGGGWVAGDHVLGSADRQVSYGSTGL